MGVCAPSLPDWRSFCVQEAARSLSGLLLQPKVGDHYHTGFVGGRCPARLGCCGWTGNKYSVPLGILSDFSFFSLLSQRSEVEAGNVFLKSLTIQDGRAEK